MPIHGTPIDFEATYASSPFGNPSQAWLTRAFSLSERSMPLAKVVTVSEPNATYGLYVVVQRDDGLVWRNDGEFVDPATADMPRVRRVMMALPGDLWELPILMTDLPTGGSYLIRVFKRAATVAATTDPQIIAEWVRRWNTAPLDSVTGTVTDHDTGGTDAMRIVDQHGNGVDAAIIRAYLTTEYQAGATSAPVRGMSETLADGRWARPIYRDATLGYTFTFHAEGRRVGVLAVEGSAG